MMPVAALLGLAAFLWLASRPAGAQEPRRGRADDGGSLDDYIRRLAVIHERELPAIREGWPKARLARAAIEAAQRRGVAPELVWGVIYGESRHKPVGLAGGGQLARALELRDSGFGVGQMTRTRWRQEAQAGAPGPWSDGYQHADQIDPRVALDAVAASYARGYRKHGGDPAADWVPEWAGRWWAGGGDGAGAQRKRRQIRQKGPAVWLAAEAGAA